MSYLKLMVTPIDRLASFVPTAFGYLRLAPSCQKSFVSVLTNERILCRRSPEIVFLAKIWEGQLTKSATALIDAVETIRSI